ncbi:MAG: T9SS type A sorting domain-containing protein [Salinivirgaceae bacterium]
MKKLFATFSLLSLALGLFAQFEWSVYFDYDWNRKQIIIDSTNNPLNKWMIGKPGKSTFTVAFSEPNAIMTDTLNSIEPNDTSVFYLLHWRDNSAPFHIFYLNFWFQMDGDSTDYGMIEISPDNGNNWINILSQDTTYDIHWKKTKPLLKGSTEGWTEFSITMENWASGEGDFPIPMTADTIIFKFTYITDSNINQHDGWIIDNFDFPDFWESIYESGQGDLLTIYPNPVKESLFLKTNSSNSNFYIQIFNNLGQIVYSEGFQDKESLNLGFLKNGIYYLRFTDYKFYTIKKVIINHN